MRAKFVSPGDLDRPAPEPHHDDRGHRGRGDRPGPAGRRPADRSSRSPTCRTTGRQGRGLGLPVHQDDSRQPAVQAATARPPTPSGADPGGRSKRHAAGRQRSCTENQAAGLRSSSKQEFANNPSFARPSSQATTCPDSFRVKLKDPQTDYDTVAQARARASPGWTQVDQRDGDPGQVLQAARTELRNAVARSSRSSWSSRRSCWSPTRSGCRPSTGAGRPASCAWSAPRTSTSSCPS